MPQAADMVCLASTKALSSNSSTAKKGKEGREGGRERGRREIDDDDR
jgi:hypothetical protein